MSKVMVIGSNSFSGASFVDFALQQGADVIGVSRSQEPIPALLPYKWRNPSKFTFLQLDLNQHLEELERVLHQEKPNYIVNFSAQSMVAESWKYPIDWFMTNTISTIRLHEVLRACDFMDRYVHISTPEVYGSCSGFVTEDHAFNPSTPYAVSRAAADMSLRTYHAAYDFPVVTTRAANVYGPGQQLYRIIPRTILFIMLGKTLQLHGGGVSTRSFIHMNDVSDATWRIMLKGENGHTYHISTDAIVSIHDLVQLICDKLNVSFADHVEMVGERLGKDASYQLDSTKLRTQLNWQDHISLDQGLDECIAWTQQYFDALKEHPYDYIHKA